MIERWKELKARLHADDFLFRIRVKNRVGIAARGFKAMKAQTISKLFAQSIACCWIHLNLHAPAAGQSGAANELITTSLAAHRLTQAWDKETGDSAQHH